MQRALPLPIELELPEDEALRLPAGQATVTARTDTGLEASAEVTIEPPLGAMTPLFLRLE